MSEHYLPDSTDWLSTPLSALAAVEGALRCQVCKDFFKTPMITSCSHTFCSLCIRRALLNDGKCPLCRATEQENKLRSNWSLEEAVQAFVSARPATLELARKDNSQTAISKRKATDDHHDPGSSSEGKRLRSSRIKNIRPATSLTVQIEDDETVEVPDSDDDDDEEYQPEPEDGLVACPICQDRMKDWQVFRHVETCTGPKPKPQRTVASVSSPIYSQQRQNTKAPDRLPTINYSMYKDQALRKKMTDLGIPNQGPRTLLERRHKEWMTIWNSNCDAARPKTRHELLQDLDVWERTLGGRAPTTGRAIQNAAIIKDKDFDGAAWAAKHDTSFKDLIANAKKTRLEAKNKAEEAARETEMEESAKPVSQTQEPDNLSQQQSSVELVIPHTTGPTDESCQIAPLHCNNLPEQPPASQPAVNSSLSMSNQPLCTHTDGDSQNT
ncbi:e3 ubiquitin- ligase rad18 [Fusarium longipes]|uniref:Postreplication repair E3 ubiquitin-protein ligase RAD18 n=1 Tax=Fusarium longipes TaxID=694270 RepID=A0A395T6H2_9HYPO|nr:e3 ubiquitin- ligase rad18 [Fusarium longipes]